MRHGEKERWGEDRLCTNPRLACVRQGLTERGKLQVAEMIKHGLAQGWLSAGVIIISSDFLRTRQSTEIAAALIPGARVIVTPLLRERCFGELDVLPYRQIYSRIQERDREEPQHCDWGVEPVLSVLSRVTRLIAMLDRHLAGRRALLMSHHEALQITLRGLERGYPGTYSEIGEIPYASLMPAELSCRGDSNRAISS